MSRTPQPRPDQNTKRLFADVLDRPLSERLAWLEGEVVDLSTRLRIQALLAAAEAADAQGFLAGEPEVPTDDGLSEPVSVGPYTLVRLLGEGGFGRVWLARQEHPIAREVAIKVIKPLDAGTTDAGLPFFVMQYVDGEPMTEYCDNRSLPVRERLAIFESICRAVHPAHQKGMIHRDLKPTNVLVAERGETPLPKVIDFGIAKALEPTPGREQTAARQILGTPRYMSPEHSRLGAVDIDTLSDVSA